MCTKPIRIINKDKYLNTKHGQAYYIWVNCGHCEECIREKQNEWTMRTFYETMDTIKHNGYIYFDTLTYKKQPRLNNLTSIVETTYNFPCFDYRDIRNFYETLRGYYKGKDRQIRYFITSEFGELRGRCHYHIMLFINNPEIEPLELSKNVNKAWNKGRTDGLPYKTQAYVLNHNVIKELNVDAIRYISKYVNKPQTWMIKVNDNWNRIEHYYTEKKKYNTIQIKRLKKEYYRFSTPFHRQSQGYGISAIEYQTQDDIYNKNRMLWKDNTIKILKYASLPTYFKRKLFQKQIEVNGKKIWIWNEDGIKYMKHRENIIIEKITDRLKDLNAEKCKLTEKEIKELAYYIYHKRGRTKGINDYEKHLEDTEAYNYNTDKDLKYIGKKCISKTFAGNDIIGYCITEIEQINDWENNILLESEKEAILDDLMKNKDTTQLTIKKEHMRQIKKNFFGK